MQNDETRIEKKTFWKKIYYLLLLIISISLFLYVNRLKNNIVKKVFSTWDLTLFSGGIALTMLIFFVNCFSKKRQQIMYIFLTLFGLVLIFLGSSHNSGNEKLMSIDGWNVGIMGLAIVITAIYNLFKSFFEKTF